MDALVALRGAVRASLEKYSAGDVILVAVSGGADGPREQCASADPRSLGGGGGAGEAAGDMKPVVVLKAGSTAAGARAAKSHTGQLAGGEAAYSAAFRRAGMIRAENFEQLFDITIALAMQPLPQGDRVAVITNAGGPGIMASDALEANGLEVATLDPATVSALRAFLKCPMQAWAKHRMRLADDEEDVLALVEIRIGISRWDGDDRAR